MFSRGDALSRLRTKSFLAVCLIGALAGVVTGLHGKGGMGIFLYGFSGAVSVIITSAVGGFLGMFLRNAALFFRGGRAEQGHINTDGIFPASSFGALVGLVVVLVAADWDQAYYGAVIGAFGGGVFGVLPGEAVGVLLRMLAFEERGTDKEEKRARERAPEAPEREIPGLEELQRFEGQSHGAVEEPGGPSGEARQPKADLDVPSEDVPDEEAGSKDLEKK